MLEGKRYVGELNANGLEFSWDSTYLLICELLIVTW